jgi:hypothetical protein
MLVEIGKKQLVNTGRNIVDSCKLVKTIVSPGKKWQVMVVHGHQSFAPNLFRPPGV